MIIPGYYGTELVERDTGRLVWISLKEALLGTTSLVLPLPTLGLEKSVALQPASILRDVPVVPFVYSVDAYGTVIAELERLLGPQVSIEPLAYDWRQDLMLTVKELHATVQRLRAEGVQRIALLAHSMGGLVAAYYLRYGDQPLEEADESWEGRSHVDAVILAGVPYLGSMSVFRNMQYGRPIGLNEDILTAQAVASFPASYYVLPSPGSDVLFSPSGERLTGMLYQPNHWKENGWGLLREGAAARPEAWQVNRLTYTTRWLEQASRFYERIHQPSRRMGPLPIPLMTITATGHETLVAGYWLGADSPRATSVLFDQKHIDEAHPGLSRSFLLSAGDGTVTVSSAALPAAYRAAFVVQARIIEASHGELVTKSALLRDMAAFLATHLADH